MSTDLDTIIKRLDECDEQRRNPPAALKTALLPAARQAAADLAALRIEHEAVCGLLTHTRKDRDDQRKRADSLALVYREAQGESDALRTQVAELQRLGASIHKAADAARKAERDRCAAIVSGWHISKGGYTELAHVISTQEQG
jgi:hypothetical protein